MRIIVFIGRRETWSNRSINTGVLSAGFADLPSAGHPQCKALRHHADKPEPGVFGVRAQITRACGPPFGCFASLRSEIVI